MSGGTSQPATESMVYALQQMGFDCGVDAHELNRINEFFIPVKDKFSANGTFDPYVLSTKTDALIRKAFAEEIPDTTKIIIAQRVSSVQDADQIVILDGGTVQAVGTHDELLAANTIYQEIYNQQNRKGGEE